MKARQKQLYSEKMPDTPLDLYCQDMTRQYQPMAHDSLIAEYEHMDSMYAGIAAQACQHLYPLQINTLLRPIIEEIHEKYKSSSRLDSFQKTKDGCFKLEDKLHHLQKKAMSGGQKASAERSVRKMLDTYEQSLSRVICHYMFDAYIPRFVQDAESLIADDRSRHETHAAMKHHMDEITKSKHRIVHANLALSVYAAKRFHKSIQDHGLRISLSLDDLVQAANIGMIKGLRMFDTKKNIQFSTFIYEHMKKAMRLEAKAAYPLKTEHKAFELYAQVISLTDRSINIDGIRPYIDKIAAELCVSDNLISNVLALSPPASLDEPISNKNRSKNPGNATIGNRIEQETFMQPDEELHRSHLAAFIRDAIRRLDIREYGIIRRFFGLDCDEETLADIGKDMSISRQRAMQLKQRAIAYLGDCSLTKVLRQYYDDMM